MKEKFYVFLDIEGTLGDIDYNAKQIDLGYHDDLDILIDPKCVSALNYLIDNLQKRFDVQLVISSDYRKYMDVLKLKLKEKGLKTIKIDSTPRINTQNQYRSKEILAYLCNKQNPYNLVIIDDGHYDFYDHFFPELIIKVDNFRRSFDINHAKTFLQPFNIENENEKTI